MTPSQIADSRKASLIGKKDQSYFNVQGGGKKRTQHNAQLYFGAPIGRDSKFMPSEDEEPPVP